MAMFDREVPVTVSVSIDVVEGSPSITKWARSIDATQGEAKALEFLRDTLPGVTYDHMMTILGRVMEPSGRNALIRFQAFETYDYAALKAGGKWYVTQNGERRDSRVGPMSWSQLSRWAGPSFQRTVRVVE